MLRGPQTGLGTRGAEAYYCLAASTPLPAAVSACQGVSRTVSPASRNHKQLSVVFTRTHLASETGPAVPESPQRGAALPWLVPLALCCAGLGVVGRPVAAVPGRLKAKGTFGPEPQHSGTQPRPGSPGSMPEHRAGRNLKAEEGKRNKSIFVCRWGLP